MVLNELENELRKQNHQIIEIDKKLLLDLLRVVNSAYEYIFNRNRRADTYSDLYNALKSIEKEKEVDFDK